MSGATSSALFAAAKGGLWQRRIAHWRPRTALGRHRSPGSMCRLGTPPAAETDGPVGAALLAGRVDRRSASPAALVTDEPCRATCARGVARHRTCRSMSCRWAALSMTLVALWRRQRGHPCAVASSAAGAAPTARRATCAARTSAPSPRRSTSCSSPGRGRRIAIGDGGNEIGMGSLPASLIARARRARRDDRLRHAGRSSDRGRRVELGRLCAARRARGDPRRLARVR